MKYGRGLDYEDIVKMWLGHAPLYGTNQLGCEKTFKKKVIFTLYTLGFQDRYIFCFDGNYDASRGNSKLILRPSSQILS